MRGKRLCKNKFSRFSPGKLTRWSYFRGGNSTVENHSYFSVGMGELLGVCVGGGGGAGVTGKLLSDSYQ